MPSRNIGISRGRIEVITSRQLSGRAVINAQGLVVSPGFIDLHQHGQNEENYRFKVMDGVTMALELEVGTGDIDRWYAEREGKTLINYGVSIGHLAARMAAMHDPISFLPTGEAARRAATDLEIAEMKQRIEHGLRRGAVAVGFGIQYIAQGFALGDSGDVSCRRTIWRVVPRAHAKRRVERTGEQHSGFGRSHRGGSNDGRTASRRPHSEYRRASHTEFAADDRRSEVAEDRRDDRMLSLHRRHDGHQVGYF